MWGAGVPFVWHFAEPAFISRNANVARGQHDVDPPNPGAGGVTQSLLAIEARKRD